MANWYGATRTNYFTVTNEERYSVLFSCLQGGEDSVEDFTETRNGKTLHGFGSYGDIYYYPEVDLNGNVKGSDDYDDDDGNIDEFLWEISKILSPDSAFVIHTVGHEKLRYLSSNMAIVLPGKAPIWKSMNEIAVEICQEELGSGFKLDIEY